MTNWNSDDYQEAFQERAAIMEYCAGLPRAEAEYRARRCLETPAAPQPARPAKPPMPEPENDNRSPVARDAISKVRQIINGE